MSNENERYPEEKKGGDSLLEKILGVFSGGRRRRDRELDAAYSQGYRTGADDWGNHRKGGGQYDEKRSSKQIGDDEGRKAKRRDRTRGGGNHQRYHDLAED